jgi:hypothetical protein
LSFVDGRSLLQASETCVKLNDIIDLHHNLIDNIWVKIAVGDSSEDGSKDFLRVMSKSRRQYKQLFLNTTQKHWLSDKLFLDMMEHFGQSLTALATDNVKFSTRKQFVDTLRLFPKLRRLQLKMVTIEDEENPENSCLDEFVHFPHLQELYLVEFYPWFCDILSPNVNLKSIEAYIIKWTETDTIPFENFVYKQASLQKLRLGLFRQGRLFKTDRTKEAKFQLDHLLLNGAFYANRENILKFVQSQLKVKKLRINLVNEYERKLDETLFYNDVMAFILSRLPELKTFGVHQDKFKFPSLDFIRELKPNKNVENLHIEGESVDIFGALVTSVFPNIKKLIYDANLYPTSVPDVAVINQMQNLEHLALNMFFVESLHVLRLEKLKSFEFVSRSNDGDFASSLHTFMSRHQALTRLRIGVVKIMANLAISMEVCKDIVASLTQLESLNIQNFEDTNANICYLASNMTNLCSLEVSSEQYKIINSDTFDLCAFNGVGISIGK